jgi:hypothetical protein
LILSMWKVKSSSQTFSRHRSKVSTKTWIRSLQRPGSGLYKDLDRVSTKTWIGSLQRPGPGLYKDLDQVSTKTWIRSLQRPGSDLYKDLDQVSTKTWIRSLQRPGSGRASRARSRSCRRKTRNTRSHNGGDSDVGSKNIGAAMDEVAHAVGATREEGKCVADEQFADGPPECTRRTLSAAADRVFMTTTALIISAGRPWQGRKKLVFH